MQETAAHSAQCEQLKATQAKDRKARQTALEAARQKQQEREREFRELLLQAQQDVAASRDITLRAEKEQRVLQEEVLPSIMLHVDVLCSLDEQVH